MFPKATHVHFGKLKNAKSKIPFLYPPELLAVDFFVGVLLDCIYLKKKIQNHTIHTCYYMSTAYALHIFYWLWHFTVECTTLI